jgi:hypothetical protein
VLEERFELLLVNAQPCRHPPRRSVEPFRRKSPSHRTVTTANGRPELALVSPNQKLSKSASRGYECCRPRGDEHVGEYCCFSPRFAAVTPAIWRRIH